MLPARPSLPLHTSIASHNCVLPLEAWPTTAKFRRSGVRYSFIGAGRLGAGRDSQPGGKSYASGSAPAARRLINPVQTLADVQRREINVASPVPTTVSWLRNLVCPARHHAMGRI